MLFSYGFLLCLDIRFILKGMHPQSWNHHQIISSFWSLSYQICSQECFPVNRPVPFQVSEWRFIPLNQFGNLQNQQSGKRRRELTDRHGLRQPGGCGGERSRLLWRTGLHAGRNSREERWILGFFICCAAGAERLLTWKSAAASRSFLPTLLNHTEPGRRRRPPRSSLWKWKWKWSREGKSLQVVWGRVQLRTWLWVCSVQGDQDFRAALLRRDLRRTPCGHGGQAADHHRPGNRQNISENRTDRIILIFIIPDSLK